MQNALFNVVNGNVSSNDYYTPKWLFDAMGLEFDIDVAHLPTACPGYQLNGGLARQMTALAQDWGGFGLDEPTF
jgi:hypothetical protein